MLQKPYLSMLLGTQARTLVDNLSHARFPATSINDENVEKIKKIELKKHRMA